MMIAVAVLLPTPEFDTAIATLSILGIGAGVHRFSQQQCVQPMVEARTLWGSVIINARSLNNGLSAVSNGSSSVDAILTVCDVDKCATPGSCPLSCAVSIRFRVAG